MGDVQNLQNNENIDGMIHGYGKLTPTATSANMILSKILLEHFPGQNQRDDNENELFHLDLGTADGCNALPLVSATLQLSSKVTFFGFSLESRNQFKLKERFQDTQQENIRDSSRVKFEYQQGSYFQSENWNAIPEMDLVTIVTADHWF